MIQFVDDVVVSLKLPILDTFFGGEVILRHRPSGFNLLAHITENTAAT